MACKSLLVRTFVWYLGCHSKCCKYIITISIYFQMLSSCCVVVGEIQTWKPTEAPSGDKSSGAQVEEIWCSPFPHQPDNVLDLRHIPDNVCSPSSPSWLHILWVCTFMICNCSVKYTHAGCAHLLQTIHLFSVNLLLNRIIWLLPRCH